MENPVIPVGQPQRIIELKLPLTYLLSILAAFAGMILTMYMKGETAADRILTQSKAIDELRAEIKVLGIEVAKGNSVVEKQNGELVLMRFRIETVESDVRLLQGKGKVK